VVLVRVKPITAQQAAPMVSVIMIFRDAESFMAEAIDSVLAQSYPGWELILVDDGSSDGSTALARRYGRQFPDRIRYLEHPGHANLGTGASRNAGVASARGEFVAFLDADDIYLPDRLQRHMEALAAFPGATVAQSCMQYWRSWGGGDGAADEQELPPAGEYQGIVAPPYLLLLLLESRGATVPGTCSLTLRRSVFLELGGCDESFRGLFEDQVLWCKLYLQHSVLVMPDVLARYRQHGTSTTGRAGAEGLRLQRHRQLEWLAEYVGAIEEPDPRIRPALDRALFEYRYPGLWSLGQAPRRGLRLLRRVGYALVPEPLAGPILERWRARKRRTAENLLDRARASIEMRP
jgi:hypothetical protein